jgi:hypothetical protein
MQHRARRLFLPELLTLGLVLLGARPGGAQEVTGSLEGRVIDEERAPVAQVLVTVAGPALQGRRTASSDEDGVFRLPALPVGVFHVRFTRLGYEEAAVEDVRVQLGRTTSLGDVRLRVHAVEVRGTTTTASRPLIDPRSTTIGSNLTAATFGGLPSDRDYQSIVTLAPGANLSYYGDRANLAGATGSETHYFVDGVNVVQPPSNSQSVSLPHNFLREVEVREGGYEAEYGAALGGVVNAVTASGGNEVHGQAFGFYANRLLTSGGLRGLGQTPADYFSWDAGLSVGGPVARDRLWYFLAYNPTSERARVGVPGHGALTDALRADRFAAKLTWRASDATNVSLSAIGDPTARDQVGGIVRENGAGGLAQADTLGNLDPYLGRQRRGGTNVSLRATRLLGTRAFLEVRLSRADARFSLMPATAPGAIAPLYIDTRTGLVEGGFGTLSERRCWRTGGAVSLSYGLRRHALKVGTEYADEAYSAHEDQSGGDLGIVLRLADSLWQANTYRDKRTGNHNRVPAAYVQDSWQAAPGLRLNLGLRWAGEYWISSGGHLGQRITDEWQPRLGFNWQPGASSAQKVLASYGRYYQSARLNTAQLFLQDVPNLYTIRVFGHDPRVDATGGTTVFAQQLGRQDAVDGLEGCGFDEFQIGWERAVTAAWKLDVRGSYRALRSGIVGVLLPGTLQIVYGNPGSGDLQAFPRLSRIRRALTVSLEHHGPRGTFAADWVLASNRGNYEGYWDQSIGDNDPLGAGSFVASAQLAANTDGPLPNDRTHTLKLLASRSLPYGLGAGATFLWASGTPLDELGASPYGYPYFVYLEPRGSAGRTPSLYDLNVRLTWTAPPRAGASLRLLADLYHLGNPRRGVFFDQLRYRSVTHTGEQTSPNPSYGKALIFQPPVAARFGLELDW